MVSKGREKKHAFTKFQLAEAFRYGHRVTKSNEEALKLHREDAKNGPEDLVDERIIKELTDSILA